MNSADNRKVNEHCPIPPAIPPVLCRPPQKKRRLYLDPESDMDVSTNIQGKVQSQKQSSISITGEESVAKKVDEQSKDEKKKGKAKTDGVEPVVTKLRGISMKANVNIMTEGILFSEYIGQKRDSTKTSLSKETLSSESGPSTASHGFSYKMRKNVSPHHSTPKSSSATSTKTHMVRDSDIAAMLPTSDCHIFKLSIFFFVVYPSL